MITFVEARFNKGVTATEAIYDGLTEQCRQAVLLTVNNGGSIPGRDPCNR